MGTKEKKELAILVVGVIILIGLLVSVKKPSRRSIGEQIPMDMDKEKPIDLVVSSGAPFSEIQIEEKIGYTGRENKDPLDNSMIMQPQSLPSTPTPEKPPELVFPKEKFSVSAVIWGGGQPQAIINNKVVNVGELLDGGKIVEIDKEGVHLSFGGKEVLLPIT